MNAERARQLLLGLPHVVEKAQFGGIIFCLGDLAIGGKMFALVNPDAAGGLPGSFLAGAERMAELLEREGFRPAPYLARAHWVAAERWDALRDREWEDLLHNAHCLTEAKLTRKTRQTLELPRAELKRAVAERTALLTARKAAEGHARRKPSWEH